MVTTTKGNTSLQNGSWDEVVTQYYGSQSLSSGFTQANEYSYQRTSTTSSLVRKGAQRKGSFPMNPFDFSNRVINNVRGRVTRDGLTNFRFGSTTTHNGCLEGYQGIYTSRTYNTLSAAERNSIDGKVRNKLLLKLKDQKLNLAQAAVEYKMTADTIAASVGRINTAYLNLKRGNFAMAAEALGVVAGQRARKRYKEHFNKSQPKAVANGWLELQYGWRPFINDVYGAAEHLANLHNTVFYHRAAAVGNGRNVYFENVLDAGKFQRQTRVTVDYTTKYVVYFSVSNSGLQQAAALGLTNPGVIAWEITPFSFVADWFLPVGNYLQTFDATLGLRFEKGCVTTFERAVVHDTWSGTRNVSDTLWSIDARADAQHVHCQRQKLLDFPSNALPEFKNPVSWEHAANALALLAQLKTSKKLIQ